MLIIFLNAHENNISEVFTLPGHTPRIFHNEEEYTSTFVNYILCIRTTLPILHFRKTWKYKSINIRKVELIKKDVFI